MGDVFRPFKASNNIPILGQAFKVLSGFSTVLIECGCEAKTPLLLVGASNAVCPSCARVFGVPEAVFNNQSGQVNAKVGVGQLPKDAVAPQPELVGAES